MKKERPKRKELLKMPRRAWNDTSREYDQLLLVPDGTKHESGYMHIAVIGVFSEKEETKYEICAYPDDIQCHFPNLRGMDDYCAVRMDCWYPQSILQYHGRGKFRVGEALSSVDLYFTNTPQQ